jgi:hypothetical protein
MLDVNSHSTFLRYYSFAARIEGWDDPTMPVADDVGPPWEVRLGSEMPRPK